MFNRLDTTILRVHNIVKAKKWYEEKLNLTPLYVDEKEKLAVLDAGENSSLTIWQIKPGESLIPATPAGCYPIFSVNNAPEVRDKLHQNGVKTSKLFEGNGVIFFHLFDPDENILEACQVHE